MGDFPPEIENLNALQTDFVGVEIPPDLNYDRSAIDKAPYPPIGPLQSLTFHTNATSRTGWQSICPVTLKSKRPDEISGFR